MSKETPKDDPHWSQIGLQRNKPTSPGEACRKRNSLIRTEKSRTLKSGTRPTLIDDCGGLASIFSMGRRLSRPSNMLGRLLCENGFAPYGWMSTRRRRRSSPAVWPTARTRSGASGNGIRDVFGGGPSSSSRDRRAARISPILTVSWEPGIWRSHGFPSTVNASDAQAARMHLF